MFEMSSTAVTITGESERHAMPSLAASVSSNGAMKVRAGFVRHGGVGGGVGNPKKPRAATHNKRCGSFALVSACQHGYDIPLVPSWFVHRICRYIACIASHINPARFAICSYATVREQSSHRMARRMPSSHLVAAQPRPPASRASLCLSQPVRSSTRCLRAHGLCLHWLHD